MTLVCIWDYQRQAGGGLWAREMKLFGVRSEGDGIVRSEEAAWPHGGAASPDQRGTETQPCLRRKPRAGERKTVGRRGLGAE